MSFQSHHKSDKSSKGTWYAGTCKSQASESLAPSQHNATPPVRTYSWVATDSKQIRNARSGRQATVKKKLQTTMPSEGGNIARAVMKFMKAEGWAIEVWDDDALKSIETVALHTLQATRETWSPEEQHTDISDRFSPECLDRFLEVYALLTEDADLQTSRLARWHKETGLEDAREAEEQP